jgi:hypothetical protein
MPHWKLSGQVYYWNLIFYTHIYLLVKMEQTECSETSEYKLQTPGYHPKESMQHTEHGESLKSRILYTVRALQAVINEPNKM